MNPVLLVGGFNLFSMFDQNACGMVNTLMNNPTNQPLGVILHHPKHGYTVYPIIIIVIIYIYIYTYVSIYRGWFIEWASAQVPPTPLYLGGTVGRERERDGEGEGEGERGIDRWMGGWMDGWIDR